MKTNNKKVIVFDLGGTLMEFRNMPPVWVDYYRTGFDYVNSRLGLGLNEDDIIKAAEIMKSFNPRVNYRENEIAPVEIFTSATRLWNANVDVEKVIDCFFDGIRLDTITYDYAVDLLEHCKNEGYIIACLTDLPSGMPDCIFKKPLKAIIERLDLYVSSQSCGYRKPNAFGLKFIAEHFGADVSELLFIGDEEKDKSAAENAGCEFKFITEIISNNYSI